jgi:hypothetical protein
VSSNGTLEMPTTADRLKLYPPSWGVHIRVTFIESDDV